MALLPKAAAKAAVAEPTLCIPLPGYGSASFPLLRSRENQRPFGYGSASFPRSRGKPRACSAAAAEKRKTKGQRVAELTLWLALLPQEYKGLALVFLLLLQGENQGRGIQSSMETRYKIPRINKFMKADKQKIYKNV
jgi:hypothetical protein